jgi:glucose/arabinose dehydrogenase
VPRFLPVALLSFAVFIACGDDESAPPPKPACNPPPRAATSNVALAAAAPFGDRTFDNPIEIVSGPGGRFYVLEQKGIARVVPPGGGEPTVAIDLTSNIVAGGEAGLLGIAFDPGFADNGFVYLHFDRNVEEKPGIVFQSVIARYESNDGGATFDAASEKILLTVDQPFSNHNGGKIAFSPDRLLFIGFGDGGSGGDPRGNGQNKDVLLGKILRIDPNGGDPYAIPPSNPFANGGGRPEIFAYGMRNPWKFAFDATTGDLWCADVGQSRYEEIDKIEIGGNYGWNTREGAHCFPAGAECSADGFIDPVVEYGRADGQSVSGGYVYRGSKIPGLFGKYVYGDFGSGTIWAVEQGPDGKYFGAKLAQTEFKISTFAQGEDGEMFVADFATGRVQALVPAEGAPPAQDGMLLSQTGCVDPASKLLAYDVASPLWSDGADKQRSLFVPEGKKIGVAADGDFDVPPGSVAVKTFTIGDKKIETRLFVRYEDGGWAGYSYEWNDEQTDAALLATGKTKDVPGFGTWTFPSRGECFSCHTAAAGFTLGLEARQVDVDKLASVLDRPVSRDAFPRLDPSDGRAYLHSNCSMCHREGAGAGAAVMDLRFDRSVADLRSCNVDPSAGNLGIADAKIVVPGDPSKSTLTLRMRALDSNRMPPLASRKVDEAGTNAVESWIRSLTTCP